MLFEYSLFVIIEAEKDVNEAVKLFDVWVFKEGERKKTKVNETPLTFLDATKFSEQLKEGSDVGVVFEKFFLSEFEVEIRPNFEDVVEFNLIYKVPSRSVHRTYESEWVEISELEELKRQANLLEADAEVTDVKIIQRTTKYDVIHQTFPSNEEATEKTEVVPFPEKQRPYTYKPQLFGAISALWGADFDKILFENDKDEIKKLNRAVEKENLRFQTRMAEQDGQELK